MAERVWAQRREFLILLPIALLLLVALSTFVLLAYRTTVRILIEDRRAEAARLARLVAGELELGARLSDDEIRNRLPSARAVAVLDERGQLIAATEPRAVRGGPQGPWDEDLVSGTARYQRDGKSFAVQVDLPAAILRSRERGLRVLTPVVLIANGVITVLVLVFLRYFWAPFENLIARARESGREIPARVDEVDFLVETFGKALEGLAGSRADGLPEPAERRLAEILSQLGELTAGVAHELRNSLATLRGYLTLIERAPAGEPITGDLAEIRRESDHLERVLEDFLTFARPGTARPQEVDLLALAHRAAADPALGGAEVAIDPWEGDGAPRVQGDPQLLERALRNLVANAVEAQTAGRGDRAPPPSEPVRIGLRRDGGGIEVRIDDRGPGLSPEAREKLFDPFFSERRGGVGMGLALTRRIVLLHGGRIDVDTRAGGGARAKLWVPVGRNVTIGSAAGSEPESRRPA